MNLSEHYTLGEVTKTSVKTADGNIPSHVAIENLKNLCENWLEDLRYSYNTLYPSSHLERSREISPCASLSRDDNGGARDDNPIIISSGYRSPEVNKAVGGAPTSNHLTGCAVDIRCEGFEQALRYANILMDIADGTKRDYDELFIERNKQGRYWIHFAVRPKDNRRRTSFIIS
ncbi:Peptidase M15 [Prevotella sp. ne3005]|nr:Peptidase M15 [Prevotella sp. ne3005]